MAIGITDLRRGWFCDHAPGRGKVITAGSAPNLKNLYYFEVQVVASSSSSKLCIGICNLGFNISNPVSLDLAAGAYAGLNGGCFTSFGNAGSNSNGWSGGTTAPSTSGMPFSIGDWIGVAVNTVTGNAWWHNASASPGTWSGGAGAGTPDPVAGVQGYAYDSLASMSGNVFALVGGGNENASPYPSGLCNFGGSPFIAKPTGYIAWGSADTLNPSDAAAQVVLSSGNLGFTTTAISGTNQPTAFVRSKSSKESA